MEMHVFHTFLICESPNRNHPISHSNHHKSISKVSQIHAWRSQERQIHLQWGRSWVYYGSELSSGTGLVCVGPGSKKKGSRTGSVYLSGPI